MTDARPGDGEDPQDARGLGHDQSQGPGWWLASDGKWYPPDQAPAVPPPETWEAPPGGPPPSPGMSTGAKVAIAVVVGLASLGVLSVLALVFVGADAETTAPVDVPAGFAVVEGDGVSIAAPDDWQKIAPEHFRMTAEEFEVAFPDAPAGFFERSSSTFDEDAVLVAFEPAAVFASNVSVIEAPGEAPLDAIEREAGASLQAVGADLEATSRVALPEGTALRIAYTMDIALPDGQPYPTNGVQYFLPSDGRSYIITVSTDDEDPELAGEVAETFRVG